MSDTFDIDDKKDAVKEYLEQQVNPFKKDKHLASFEEFLSSLQNNQKIRKRITFSADDSPALNYLDVRSSLPEEERDISDIAYIASRQGSVETIVSCVSFTSFKSFNPSVDYKYANTPQYNTCSNENLVKSANTNSPLPCSYNFLALSSCSYFKPDASLVARNSVNDNVFSLGKYRSITGTFIYVIYDKDLNVYQTLNYKGITDKDNSLDLAATEIYNDFLSNQMMLETTSIDIPAKVQEASSKSSYLLSLIS